ncbi:MAG: acetyl-CoA carboxylase, carboxyltransferase subunit beta [Firmicutes bacterium]|nr:acetyl-CoA carboxylase, carboxyltransferase subunit beta [Bacillota bacterium]
MPNPFAIFKKPLNKPELKGREAPKPKMPDDDLCIVCSSCGKSFFNTELADSLFVCPKCSFYHRVPSRERVKMLTDEDSFVELNEDLVSKNIIEFPEYDDKLDKAIAQSNENEAVICGTATIDGEKCALFVMDPIFMMGSMGTVVGEKITLLFEHALEHKLPVIGYSLSGGARMQEGILSLKQMAKTASAVKRHSNAGLLYIVVLCDPTTGGVTASFAMLGDIILAEPKALVGFAGPRVIEQTIRQKLPIGFQRAEFLLEKGFVDNIVPRKDQPNTLARLIRLHKGGSR